MTKRIQKFKATSFSIVVCLHWITNAQNPNLRNIKQNVKRTITRSNCVQIYSVYILKCNAINANQLTDNLQYTTMPNSPYLKKKSKYKILLFIIAYLYNICWHCRSFKTTTTRRAATKLFSFNQIHLCSTLERNREEEIWTTWLKAKSGKCIKFKTIYILYWSKQKHEYIDQ